jgi:hypothetical protein
MFFQLFYLFKVECSKVKSHNSETKLSHWKQKQVILNGMHGARPAKRSYFIHPRRLRHTLLAKWAAVQIIYTHKKQGVKHDCALAHSAVHVRPCVHLRHSPWSRPKSGNGKKLDSYACKLNANGLMIATHTHTHTHTQSSLRGFDNDARAFVLQTLSRMRLNFFCSASVKNINS